MTKFAFAYASELRPAFLAHMANRLDRLICKQTKEMMLEAGVQSPVTCFSIMVFLSKHGPGTIADIARIDGQSHQLIQSRISPLEKLGLVKTEIDPRDSRCRRLMLTAAGERDAQLIEEISDRVAKKIAAMNQHLGTDLMTTIEEAEKFLTQNPLN